MTGQHRGLSETKAPRTKERFFQRQKEQRQSRKTQEDAPFLTTNTEDRLNLQEAIKQMDAIQAWASSNAWNIGNVGGEWETERTDIFGRLVAIECGCVVCQHALECIRRISTEEGYEGPTLSSY